MQETWVQFLVQEDPTCCGATKLVHHDYVACAPEPGNHNYWAHLLQLLKSAHSKTFALQHKKPPQWKAHAPQLKSSPCVLKESYKTEWHTHTRCSSVGEIHKWTVEKPHNGIVFSTKRQWVNCQDIKKIWKNLKCILLSGRSQSEKTTYCMIWTTWNFRKDKSREINISDCKGQG